MNLQNTTAIPQDVAQNAACAGRWDLFDPRRDDETRGEVEDRWEVAQDVCAHCPVLAQCRDWYRSIPPGEPRPEGVVAGVVRSALMGRPRVRPRRTALASSVHAGAPTPAPRVDGTRDALEATQGLRRHHAEPAVA